MWRLAKKLALRIAFSPNANRKKARSSSDLGIGPPPRREPGGHPGAPPLARPRPWLKASDGDELRNGRTATLPEENGSSPALPLWGASGPDSNTENRLAFGIAC